MAVGFRLRRRETENHLFGGFAEQLRHSQVEFHRQPLDLLVNRVRQKHFSFFHGSNVTSLRNRSKAPVEGIEIAKLARLESRPCQTCKYMGVDFLDFLRSGEKDIHAFAETRRKRQTQPSQPTGLPSSANPDGGGQP